MTQNNVQTFVIDDADGLLPPNDPARIADEAAPAKKKPKSKKGSSIQHVELAKAGRAKCQISGKQIERGELRLGVDSNYRGHVSIKWLDPRFVKQEIDDYAGLEQDLTSLNGWAELAHEKRAELCAMLGFSVPDEAGSPNRGKPVNLEGATLSLEARVLLSGAPPLPPLRNAQAPAPATLGAAATSKAHAAGYS